MIIIPHPSLLHQNHPSSQPPPFPHKHQIKYEPCNKQTSVKFKSPTEPTDRTRTPGESNAYDKNPTYRIKPLQTHY
ncbi:hypothetical protein BDQ94DRAFT_43500 [Aspergillus welwitschiae]|uniref:Uncharacterized protein n=1 Tax=Aspergillus welwitschiae TaxID=1341132 RepID=A0A3F3QHC9_9EURO|nr:hypothetical protein BDQ94DRAFT_43500 [Aspergillus welwitschiae]RDH38352.1 hypothetical protein BDQ94DRAFT_43500 [Aspergillus welwitschiae]